MKALLKLIGIHLHDWNPYGESYTEHYEQQVPLLAASPWSYVVTTHYDEFEEKDILENVPSSKFIIERWSKDFQKRTCSTCGKEERRCV